MDQEKVGQFIKNIRKQNGYTQREFSKALGVSFQAVSKWELGKSLPDISTLQLISQKFNINLDELLNGERKQNRSIKNTMILLIFIFLILASVVTYIIFHHQDQNGDFEFKTISTSCDNFTITGSAAYDKNKTSIYISDVNYCGIKNDTIYKQITCNLYEKYGKTNTLITSCGNQKDLITLDDYLDDVTINVDNYSAMCKKFTDSSLYLQISALQDDGNFTVYEIPITLEENC